MQRQRLLVINTKEGIEKIKECTQCDFGASTIIVISYEKDDEENESEFSRKYGLIDTGIVATHMCLEATNLGLGTVMVGLFDRELTKEKFNIPRKYQPELLLPIGYIDRKPSILHSRRKAIEETVKRKCNRVWYEDLRSIGRKETQRSATMSKWNSEVYKQ